MTLKTWSSPPDTQINPWKEAVINELIVAGIWNSSHDDDPRKAINDAIQWNIDVALDPRVSKEAQALIDQGKASIIQTEVTDE